MPMTCNFFCWQPRTTLWIGCALTPSLFATMFMVQQGQGGWIFHLCMEVDHVQEDCALATLHANAQWAMPVDARQDRPVGYPGRVSERPPPPPAIRACLLPVERRELSVPLLPIQARVPTYSGGSQGTGLHNTTGWATLSSVRAILGLYPSRGAVLGGGRSAGETFM